MQFNKYHDKDISQYSFLVTGGAGFIGSNIVGYLIQHGAKKVRVLDNFATGSRANLKDYIDLPQFELIEGDIRDPQTCMVACEGMDYVTHQAALGSVPRSINDPITSNNVNISGFLNMLVAARDHNCKRFVYAASSSTYGDHPALPKKEENIGKPLSPYAVTKYVNELYADVFARTYNYPSVGLRYFNVFGPRQNPKGPYAAVIPLFIEAILKNEPAYINGDGETSRDFTFVANAVQANIKAMLHTDDITTHEVVNVAFGGRTTLNQLWGHLCKANGIDISPIYREERKGDVRHSQADISKAHSLFGYEPEYSMQDGLAIALNWYKVNLSMNE